jgi:hypothetical protein
VADPQLFDMARAPVKESVSPSGQIGKETPNPYSYEHRITLNGEDADKLGIGTPKVGDVFDTAGLGHVVSVSQQDSQNGKSERRIEIQMKRMAMKARQKKGKSALDTVSDAVDSAPSGEGE